MIEKYVVVPVDHLPISVCMIQVELKKSFDRLNRIAIEEQAAAEAKLSSALDDLASCRFTLANTQADNMATSTQENLSEQNIQLVEARDNTFRAEVALSESLKETEEAKLQLDVMTQQSEQDMQQHNVALEGMENLRAINDEYARKIDLLNVSNAALVSSNHEKTDKLALTLKKMTESDADYKRYEEHWVNKVADVTRMKNTSDARVATSAQAQENVSELNLQLDEAREKSRSAELALSDSLKKTEEAKLQLDVMTQQSKQDMQRHNVALDEASQQLITVSQLEKVVQRLKTRNEILLKKCVNDFIARQSDAARSVTMESANDAVSRWTREMILLQQQLYSWERRANGFLTSMFPTLQGDDLDLVSSPYAFFDTVHDSVTQERRSFVERLG